MIFEREETKAWEAHGALFYSLLFFVVVVIGVRTFMKITSNSTGGEVSREIR